MMTSSHPSQVSIIMHTPTDIIREIFLQCVLAPCQLPPSLTEPRLVLTHVCSAWREIALDMPKLWTDIILDPRHPGMSVHGRAIISAWLSRSSPCQISLQISRPANKSDLYRDLILPTLHRCQHLNLRTAGADLQRLLSTPVGTFLDLEDIRIFGVGPTWQVVEDLFCRGQVTAFQGCPRLRRIRFFIHTTIPIDLHSLKFPWGQLSALVLRWIMISPISCLRILQECVLLQECSFSISFIDLVIDTPIVALSKQPLLLPSLHILSLGLMNHHALFLAALHISTLHSPT
ncbi:hypothetical protein BD779DRAFT_331115 [Infundibulicybe gibba]|nr:hypothetical protein BD779DRAFT_331115 [Infundibulicybe gibba]